jgi:uncharacterized protein YdeI (BOF family)
MEPNDEDKPFTPPPSRRETLVPALAVIAVAIVAVAAAVMARGSDDAPQPQFARQASGPAAADGAHAPPLAEPNLRAMGSAPACRDCGVVQTVVAVYDHGRKQPRAFQVHVRMDDGSVRTVEQRGALAAGARVVVDGSIVRPMS